MPVERRLTAYSVARFSVRDLWAGMAEDGETSPFLLLSQSGGKAQTPQFCVRHRPLQNDLPEPHARSKCLAIVLQRVHWGLLRGSWGESALMTWMVTQLCFYLCALQPSPGLQNSREPEVVAAHSTSVTWKHSWMKPAFPRGSTAGSGTETPLGGRWTSIQTENLSPSVAVTVCVCVCVQPKSTHAHVLFHSPFTRKFICSIFLNISKPVSTSPSEQECLW